MIIIGTKQSSLTTTHKQDDSKNKFHLPKKVNCFAENEQAQPIDLGFFRKVKLIEKGIARKLYADNALTSRMKARQTNLHISDLEDNIHLAIKNFKNKKPIELQTILQNELRDKVVEKIQRILIYIFFKNG